MRTFLLSILIIALLAPLALAENTELGEGRWFTLYNTENKVLLRTGIRIYVGDRFLDSDNCLYHVYKVDSERLRAWAREVDNEEARAVSPVQGLPGADNFKIALYHTHSGESYLPSDGVDSTDQEQGGVYGVGGQLSSRLEKKDELQVIHCQDTFFPYSGSYRRSRVAALNLVEEGDLDAIFDLHRDAAPEDEYYREIEDMQLTQVMIVVGTQNPVYQVNEEFAWQLKEVGDSMYPGLVKGIFYAKGDYNQDLHPRALLLEVGAHTNSRQQAEIGVRAFGDVIYATLYGSLPEDSETEEEIKENPQLQPTADPPSGSQGGVLKGLLTLVGMLGLGGIFYLLLSVGSWQGVKKTVSHFFRVEFRDVVSSIPWHKFYPRYIFRQFQALKLGSGAPLFLKRVRDWWHRLINTRNRL
jgi:stage II sporulation protein P